MAIPVWPSTLPQSGAMNTSGGPQNNVVSFKPEVGPSIDRRRASTVTRKRSVELPILTMTQYNTFVSFFENTLYDGTLPFTWVDPITGVSSKVKFVRNDPAYNEEKITSNKIKISFELMVMK